MLASNRFERAWWHVRPMSDAFPERCEKEPGYLATPGVVVDVAAVFEDLDLIEAELL